MKMNIALILLGVGVLVAVVVMSCKPKQVVEKPTSSTSKEECPSILVDAGFMKDNPSTKSVKIESAKIVGDCLEVAVSHGGGCPKRPNKYNLVWNKKILKSMPPQVVLVMHLDSEDYCKAIVRETLQFDLKAVQMANPRGEVIVRLRDYEQRLNYKFSSAKDE